jgi:acyl-CoA:acyl-CoA alkyltransferase
MQIAGVHAHFPSRIVTNEDVLQLIRTSGHALSRHEETEYLQKVEKVLEYSGAERRYWLADDERPGDVVRAAILGAVEDAGLRAGDIDTFIYAAVSRGFLEPAESYVLAKSCGLAPQNCFDVLEACNSFSRAADLAQLLLKSGRSRNVLIAVGEFCVNGSGYVLPNFKPAAIDELAWRFPSYTLGEGAAAVVLTSGGSDWTFRVRTRTDLAHACLVALPHGPVYAPDLGMQPDETELFRSFGQEMHLAAVPASIELWNAYRAEDEAKAEGTGILFPHAPSRKLCEDFSAQTGFPFSRIFQLYTRLGNIGSASVPMGIHFARREGRLQRGEQVACLVGAAGMSFMLYDFVF